MSFFLDTQETYQRFDNQVAEVRSLLDTNHVRYGSPDDFFEFAKTLESSNQFRLDLSALVKSVVKKSSDELLLTDMMSIIAVSVGGPSFESTQANITKPSNILLEFLLGTGCWRYFGSPLNQTSQGGVSPSGPSIRTEEPRGIRIASTAASVSPASEHLEDRSSLRDLSNELRQTLSQLESGTMQVKRRLDSIERQISRIEPPPNVLPDRTSLISDPGPRSAAADIVDSNAVRSTAEDIPVFEPELPTRGRAVFSHQFQRDESEMDDDGFSSPTFAYATEKRRSIIPLGVFLVLLVIAAAGFFLVHSGQGHGLVNIGLSRLKNVRALFGKAPTPAPPPPSTPVPALTSAAPAAAPASTAASDTSAKSGIEPPATHSKTSDDSTPNVEPAIPVAPDNPPIRNVSAHVMAGHLLSAPRPEYPALARTNHIEGQVVLQATISNNGSVEAVHAIKGSQSLRNAAINAVRNWRYTPYLINGRPVEVTTTVYVDFSLKPPPAIVH